MLSFRLNPFNQVISFGQHLYLLYSRNLPVLIPSIRSYRLDRAIALSCEQKQWVLIPSIRSYRLDWCIMENAIYLLAIVVLIPSIRSYRLDTYNAYDVAEELLS